MSHQFQPFQRQNRSKVAVVTGGNKGVGYALVRKLLKKFRGDVYLTARNEQKGLAACEQLKNEGLHPPKFFQLDITDREQIMEFRHHLEKTYGGIDVLINNASVPHKTSSADDHHDEHECEDEEHHHEHIEATEATSHDVKTDENGVKVTVNIGGVEEEKKEVTVEDAAKNTGAKPQASNQSPAENYKAHKKLITPKEGFWVPEVHVDPVIELAEMTMKTNVVGTLNVIHCLLPLFRMHGRIINISSSLGVLSSVTGAAIKDKLADTYLLESDLVEFLKTYITDVTEKKAEEKGWPPNVWVLSKLAINVLTRILARDHKYEERKDVLITACCPDLSEDHTPFTADQGAESPLYLALLAKGNKNLHGKIFKDKKIMEWEY